MDEITYKQLVDTLQGRGFKQYSDLIREPESSWYLSVPEYAAPLDSDGRKQQLTVHIYRERSFPNGNTVDATVSVVVNGNVHSNTGEIVLGGFTYGDIINDITFARVNMRIWDTWRVLVAPF